MNLWAYIIAVGLLIGVVALLVKRSDEIKRFFLSIWFVYFFAFLLLCMGGGDAPKTSASMAGVMLMSVFYFPIAGFIFLVIPYYQVKWMLYEEQRSFKRACSYVLFGWMFFLMTYHSAMFGYKYQEKAEVFNQENINLLASDNECIYKYNTISAVGNLDESSFSARHPSVTGTYGTKVRGECVKTQEQFRALYKNKKWVITERYESHIQ
ncbi:MAG: hypothetical protein ACQET8_20365 [Bacillota bacterium]